MSTSGKRKGTINRTDDDDVYIDIKEKGIDNNFSTNADYADPDELILDDNGGRIDFPHTSGVEPHNIMMHDHGDMYDSEMIDDIEYRREIIRKELDLKSNVSYNRFMGRPMRKNGIETFLEDIRTPISLEIKIQPIDISKFSPDPIFHKDVDYPSFALGFHHWMHASKNKTEIFDQFAGKKKVYHVVNGYERYIDYDENIGNVSKKFFGLDGKPNILTRAFYKLWELVHYYDLIDIDSKKFISAHLAEGPGSFIQTTMFYRDMFSSNSKNDKYYAITIHGDSEDRSFDMEKEFMEYYSKEKSKRIFIHKTYDTETSTDSSKDNGDLTKSKTINNFIKLVGEKVDLVTGDGGFEWNNENIQEQECALLILSQILTAVNIQKKGGHFVLKMFEMFTKLSAKFVLILKYFYDEVHITKPLTSRESNSERYLICKGFKFNDGQTNVVQKNLMAILDKISEDVYIFDIYPDIPIPDDLYVHILTINVEISNLQFKVINKIISYLEGSNFYGELYSQYRSRQIESTKYWLSVFMGDSKDNTKAIERAVKMIQISNIELNKNYDIYKDNLRGINIAKKTMSRPKRKRKINKKD